MMNEQDAATLLKMAEQIGVRVWIDGGWGVDALVGHQTRPHNDIDIFIEKKDRTVFTEMLIREGYNETKMEYTTEDHTVWRDSSGHIVDLHLFEFGEAGTLYYDNEVYPSNVLSGKGTIGGIAVRCLTAKAQLLFHQGYEHNEKDAHDVLLLSKTFGLPVPPEYKDDCSEETMDIKRKVKNGVKIAVVHSEEVIIHDVQSALDLMATVRYKSDCDRIAIPKMAVAEDFFVLSTGIAGEILQKFVNYHCKLAIFGDYSRYISKPLRDFIYESNNGSHIFFVDTEDEAVAKLAGITHQ